jgi:hypothetical protein
VDSRTVPATRAVAKWRRRAQKHGLPAGRPKPTLRPPDEPSLPSDGPICRQGLAKGCAAAPEHAARADHETRPGDDEGAEPADSGRVANRIPWKRCSVGRAVDASVDLRPNREEVTVRTIDPRASVRDRVYAVCVAARVRVPGRATGAGCVCARACCHGDEGDAHENPIAVHSPTVAPISSVDGRVHRERAAFQ